VEAADRSAGRPGVLIAVAIGVVALFAGAAGGFVAGHQKGKADNRREVEEARAIAVAAEASLSESQSKLTEGQGALLKAKAEVASVTARLGKELDAAKQELANSNSALRRAEEKMNNLSNQTTGKKAVKSNPLTYAELLASSKAIHAKMQDEEKVESRRILSRLSAEEANVSAIYMAVKENCRLAEEDSFQSLLLSAGLRVFVQCSLLESAFKDEKTQEYFQAIHSARSDWSGATFASKLITFQGQRIDVRLLALSYVQAKKRPDTKAACDLIRLTAGDTFFDSLK
jgi:hypothetical protein